MNKLVLLLGLITLTACTTDSAFDEYNQYNQYNEGAFTPTEQSNYQPMTSEPGYETPC